MHQIDQIRWETILLVSLNLMYEVRHACWLALNCWWLLYLLNAGGISYTRPTSSLKVKSISWRFRILLKHSPEDTVLVYTRSSSIQCFTDWGWIVMELQTCAQMRISICVSLYSLTGNSINRPLFDIGTSYPYNMGPKTVSYKMHVIHRYTFRYEEV